MSSADWEAASSKRARVRARSPSVDSSSANFIQAEQFEGSYCVSFFDRQRMYVVMKDCGDLPRGISRITSVRDQILVAEINTMVRYHRSVSSKPRCVPPAQVEYTP